MNKMEKEFLEIFGKKIKLDGALIKIKNKEGEEGWILAEEFAESIFASILESNIGKMLYEYKQKNTNTKRS